MKHMYAYLGPVILLVFLVVFISCKGDRQDLSAQQLVDKAIADAGGDLYGQSEFKFKFRDVVYVLEKPPGGRVMKRIRETDSGEVADVMDSKGFRRYLEGEMVPVTDSMANVYSSSINSVHYFAYLPYGLNDAAVNKDLLGKKMVKGRLYYKIRVTFDEEGGGEDFEDVFVYWIDAETFKPKYLAYEFHVNGGGLRFREAFNERYINGIRFVDYRNYKPEGKADITRLDGLFERGELELLSEIRLKDIEVSRGSYN